MKDKKTNGRLDKKAGVPGVRSGLVVGLVILMLFVFFTFPHPVIVNDDRSWHIVWEGSLAEAAEADPGVGAGGVLEIIFVNVSAVPATDYAINVSGTFETWAVANMPGKTPYVNADNFNCQVDHTTTFAVLVRVRGNATQCKRGAVWYSTDLRVNWTCADLSVGADTAMTGVVSSNNSGYSFLWMNFYDDNTGSGYSLTKGQNVTVTSIKFEAYY